MRWIRTTIGFIRALPQLPGAVWSQRHEIVNAVFQRHVWLGKDGRKEFEQHQRGVENWRNNLRKENE